MKKKCYLFFGSGVVIKVNESVFYEVVDLFSYNYEILKIKPSGAFSCEDCLKKGESLDFYIYLKEEEKDFKIGSVYLG